LSADTEKSTIVEIARRDYYPLKKIQWAGQKLKRRIRSNYQHSGIESIIPASPAEPVPLARDDRILGKFEVIHKSPP
jgi:hypothetical protein